MIFTQAEESLRYQEADRSLASASWRTGSPGRAANLCVLVFRQDTLDGVHDYIAALNRFPRLETFVGQAMRGDGHGTRPRPAARPGRA